MTDEELEAALGSVAISLPPADVALANFLAFTGATGEEALTITWRSIDMRKRQATIDGRRVPMPRRLMAVLSTLPRGKPRELVFGGSRYEVADVLPDTRETYIQRLVEHRVPWWQISKWTGIEVGQLVGEYERYGLDASKRVDIDKIFGAPAKVAKVLTPIEELAKGLDELADEAGED